MKSSFLSLDWKDLVKGFIVSIVTAILTAVYTAIEAGNLAFTWEFFKPVLITGLGAGIAYLIKNLFTNSQDQFIKKDNP